MKGCQPRPFAAVRLGLSLDVVDFAWNPGPDFAGLFAVCLSDGAVHLLELKGSSVAPVASLPTTTAATCCTYPAFWSSSGSMLCRPGSELIQVDWRIPSRVDFTRFKYPSRLCFKSTRNRLTDLVLLLSSILSVKQKATINERFATVIVNYRIQ